MTDRVCCPHVVWQDMQWMDGYNAACDTWQVVLPAHVNAHGTKISMTKELHTQCVCDVARLEMDGMDSQPCHNDGYSAALTSDPWQFNGTTEGRVPWDHPWGFTALMKQQTWDLAWYQWSWMPCGTGMLVERRSQLTCLVGKRGERERERWGAQERKREGEREM